MLWEMFRFFFDIARSDSFYIIKYSKTKLGNLKTSFTLINQRNLFLSSNCRGENEEEKAKKQYIQGPTIFDKIINKEIPADIIYEDDSCLAFNDINPQAPIHFLVIPKRRITMLEKADNNDQPILGKLLLIAKNLANEKTTNGYRIVINNGIHGCQSVYHLHIHVIGGRQLKWPPG